MLFKYFSQEKNGGGIENKNHTFKWKDVIIIKTKPTVFLWKGEKPFHI